MLETQRARTSPPFVIEIVTELCLLAAYAVMFALTILVVSTSTIAYAVLASAQWFWRNVGASSVSMRAR